MHPFNTRFSVVNDRMGAKKSTLWTSMAKTCNGSLVMVKSTYSLSGLLMTTPRIHLLYEWQSRFAYRQPRVSGRITRLSARDGVNIGASWHPNGKEVVATLLSKGNSDIYRLDAVTGRILGRLTTDRGIDVAASYSPDGSKIGVEVPRALENGRFIMNADGSNAKSVSFAGKYNTDPSLSPDGKRLAYVSKTNNFGEDIYTVKLDGKD